MTKRARDFSLDNLAGSWLQFREGLENRFSTGLLVEGPQVTAPDDRIPTRVFRRRRRWLTMVVAGACRPGA
jgi:hypothetical protein